MRKITIIILLFGSGLMIHACASSIPRADRAHQAWAQNRWRNIDLSEARSMYAANCSGCHNLHSPAEHTEGEWIKLFAEMAGRAHLVSSDSLKVLAYLETYSRDNRLIQ